MEQQTATPSSAPPASSAYNPARIENYYDQVHKAAWVRRTSGIFAGATLGILSGAAIGLAIAFAPYAISLVPALAGGLKLAVGTKLLLSTPIVLKCMAAYATLGGLIGSVIGNNVGVNAGAMAGGLAVREHQEVQANAQQPVIAQQKAQDAGPSGPKYFSWRPAAIFAAACGGFGAMAASSGIGFTAITNTLLFQGVTGAMLIPGTAAAIAGTAAVFGLFGISFGFKFARLSSELSNFYTKILTDDIWKKKTPEAPAVRAERQAEPPAPAPAPVQEAPAPNHAPPKLPLPEPKSLAPEDIAKKREQERSVAASTGLC